MARNGLNCYVTSMYAYFYDPPLEVRMGVRKSSPAFLELRITRANPKLLVGTQ